MGRVGERYHANFFSLISTCWELSKDRGIERSEKGQTMTATSAAGRGGALGTSWCKVEMFQRLFGAERFC